MVLINSRNDPSFEPRIAVIGAGPSGGILAAYLAKHGENVMLIDILKDRIDAIRKQGLTISGITNLHVKIPHLGYSIAELESFKPDIIFVAVKTTALHKVIPEIQVFWDPTMKVICFQNGLDTELVFESAFGSENIVRMTLNYACNMTGDASIEMTLFNKPNNSGILSKRAEGFARQISNLLTDAQFDTVYTEDLKWHTWKKTLLNIAMSALCAITKMTMKEALDFPETRKLIEESLREGIQVAKADGYEYGPDFFEECLNILHDAGHHKPSMCADLEHQGPTEIDYLNKKIVEYGDKYGIPVPFNLALTHLVKALELQNKK